MVGSCSPCFLTCCKCGVWYYVKSTMCILLIVTSVPRSPVALLIILAWHNLFLANLFRLLHVSLFSLRYLLNIWLYVLVFFHDRILSWSIWNSLTPPLSRSKNRHQVCLFHYSGTWLDLHEFSKMANDLKIVPARFLSVVRWSFCSPSDLKT